MIPRITETKFKGNEMFQKVTPSLFLSDFFLPFSFFETKHCYGLALDEKQVRSFYLSFNSLNDAKEK